MSVVLGFASAEEAKFVALGSGAAEQRERKVEETPANTMIRTVLMLHLLFKAMILRPHNSRKRPTDNPAFQAFRDHFRIGGHWRTTMKNHFHLTLAIGKSGIRASDGTGASLIGFLTSNIPV
jgi:hypothetical protein